MRKISTLGGGRAKEGIFLTYSRPTGGERPEKAVPAPENSQERAHNLPSPTGNMEAVKTNCSLKAPPTPHPRSPVPCGMASTAVLNLPNAGTP